MRTVVPNSQKLDIAARASPSSYSNGDHREYKNGKDMSKLEEVSEYVQHSVDPSAPIYEITHAIADALVLKCADCQRFARGTYIRILIRSYLKEEV